MSDDAKMVFTDNDIQVSQDEFAKLVNYDGRLADFGALRYRLAAAENPKRQQEHEKYQCGRSCERCIADKAWLRACGKAV